MNCWQGTWLAAAKKVVSSCSLLLLAAIGLAVDYKALHERLERAGGAKEQQRILREFRAGGEGDPHLNGKLDELISAWDSGYAWSPEPAIEMIQIRASLEGLSPDTNSAAQQAAEIKRDPLYRDPGIQESSNWFERAMTRFGEAISRLLEAIFRGRPGNFDAGNVGGMPNLSGLIYVVWAIVGAILLLFLYLAFRHFRWRATLHRKATAMLEEDEPERTVDEWLEQADRLAGEGKYREAVRCLYLASLLRFDEAQVARFIRSETNWEHLARIERSPAKPSALDFRTPTQGFDRIWYGFRVQGMDDVAAFRAVYQQVTEALQNRRVA